MEMSDDSEPIWSASMNMTIFADTLRSLGPLNWKNDQESKDLLRKVLTTCSGGGSEKTTSMLKSVITQEERNQLLRKLLKDLPKTEMEKLLRENSNLTREESQNLAEEISQDESSQNLLENTTIFDQDTQMAGEPVASVSGIQIIQPQRKNGRFYDKNLGWNEFSDEDSPGPSSPKKRKKGANAPLAPLTKAGPLSKRFRQRRQQPTLPSQSPIATRRTSSIPSSDPSYAPSSASTCTDSSFEEPELVPKKKRSTKDTKSKKKSSKKVPGPRTSSPIPLVTLDEESEEDEIPDFDTEDKENQENAAEGGLRILSPGTLNSRLDANDQEQQGNNNEAADEIIVLPDIHESDNDEDNNAEAVEVEVKQEKTRKIRPGKAMLFEKLRDTLGVGDDNDMSEEDILTSYQFKKTLFSSDGFAADHCPCQSLKEYHEFFEIETVVATNNDETSKLEICPKCFVFFINSGPDERRDFLQMVHQMHCQGLQVVYIRTEGQNKRVFELQGTKKWLRVLKHQPDLKTHPYLSNASKFFKIKSSKVFMELIPAAKSNCGSKLRKALRNSGDKHKIFLKVHVMNGDAYFSIRDLESGSQGKQGSSTELQTSILDYYTKR